ncbi:hypothetical protein B0T24DRAFT_53312 [Lasiosphaeria ovina]|uniref:ML-like domain-containing protein n=1 Tax=Lasiosphaeria ovina TaxID=92902 RepID=A0AAE0NL35_9PEZI|nr:hypothetical protein B0T24DRAFT_53312 [Lasiosphaeria ovina]
MAPRNRFCALPFLLLSLLSLASVCRARETQYIVGSDENGVSRQLAVDRYPALYTGDFGDCLGGQSLFNITKFDAAYYSDNLTIVFHLDGTTNIKNESLMMHISVDACKSGLKRDQPKPRNITLELILVCSDGSSRFDMIFNPCSLNIDSLCPVNASVPITGWAIIPVGPQQIGGIPPLAYGIPDFEGSTKLQIFANSSKTEIGCFQAVMRNGNTFSHPEAVAPVLGIFTLVAIIASFATAAYGISTTHMRMHHAHSLSVLVVLETFQAIFFSGALSMNWPSVCVAWWSNFAWSSGIIYSRSMIKSIDSFTGVSGNASQVGGAGSTVINTGGGLISQIYGRAVAERATPNSLARRSTYNASDPYDYTWAGNPVTPGMPTPGTWQGFPGSLSALGIPAADIFLLGLIWVVVAISLVAISVPTIKLALDLLARIKWIKEDRLAYFRSHWTGYLAHALLRAFLMSFFTMITLALFQFTIGGTSGTVAIAALAFLLFLVGVVSTVAYACRARTRGGIFEARPDRVIFYYAKLFKFVPAIIPAWASTLDDLELEVKTVFALPLSRIRHVNNDPDRPTVHEDQAYIKKFGWLSARYRRTRWWFLATHVGYLFVRAAFIGGGVNNPLAQVYGLLIFDILSFGAIAILRPFEGARNMAMAVYLLGVSKILTTGLSIAFLPDFELDRIIATAIGIVIIVIQGLLVIALMILVVLGAISSWMSLARNREDISPRDLEAIRVRYFEKMEVKAQDVSRLSKAKEDKGKAKEEEERESRPPPEPSFSVVTVRREPKIEDEDDDSVHELDPAQNGTGALDAPIIRALNRASRTNSVSSRYSASSLPRAARIHRASLSSKDFAQYVATLERPDSALAQRVGSPLGAVGHHADTSTIRSSTPVPVRPQSSSHSLRTLTDTRPSSPFGTPTREILARYADERRYTLPQQPAPTHTVE